MRSSRSSIFGVSEFFNGPCAAGKGIPILLTFTLHYYYFLVSDTIEERIGGSAVVHYGAGVYAVFEESW